MATIELGRSSRHGEAQAARQSSSHYPYLDCFAELVVGRRATCHRARTRATRWRLWPSHNEEMDYFLLFGLWPAGVLPDENGEA